MLPETVNLFIIGLAWTIMLSVLSL